MQDHVNKRSTPRLAPQARETWLLNINNDELITRNIVDISPTGIAFKAPLRSQFHEGQTLHLTVTLANQGTFDCEGKIVWARNQQFGLQFSKIPQLFDAYIMRAIHEMTLQARRLGVHDAGWAVPAGEIRSAIKIKEKKSLLSSLLDLLMIGAMAAALILAAFIHQQNNPQFSLSSIAEQAFSKRLTGPGK